jgi:hypothetical protein
MGLRGLYQRRRVAAAFALVGMAFYAVLLPWHTVSQATNALGGSAELPCHDISAAPNGEPKGSTPAKKTHCPICSGFAALQLALAGGAIDVVAPSELRDTARHCTHEDLASINLRAPQSRGPPHFPV